MTTIWKKSFAAVAVVVFVITVYFITGVLLYSSAQYNDINTWNLEETVRTLGNLTPASVFSDEETKKVWASEVGRYVPYRITLISRSGQVVYDTEADSAEMEDHLDRPEFQAAIIAGIGSSRRQSATMGQDLIYAAAGIKDTAGETASNEIAGVLRISRKVSSFSARLADFIIPFLAGGFIIILGACAGLYHFSRRLSLSMQKNLDNELENKTAELILRTGEAEAEGRRLQAVLNSMSEGVITVDSNLNITLVNPLSCSLFGFKTGENTEGKSLLEFTRLEEMEDTARQVLSTGNPCELIIKRYNSGAEQHLQVFVTPLEKIPGVVIVLGDISRLVKLEQVRKDFAANVSHELRTPIQVIKGFVENILDSSMDDKQEIRRFTEIIGKNAKTMENLANDLLTLVSLEDERGLRPSVEDTVLAPLIDEAVGIVKTAALKKNISIEVSCPPDLSAKIHDVFIIQALVNLIDNGIKYSGPDSRIKVKAFREEGRLVIEVKDKGIGIPAEHIGRIFERFYRVDRAHSRDAGSTGLGLAIVRHIALLHNGTASAESYAGKGSVFKLTLPG